MRCCVIGDTIHAVIRELCFYIPMMYLFDNMFGEKGLAAAYPASELLSAALALFLLHLTIKKARKNHMM